MQKIIYNMPVSDNRHISGFTLIELSIVMVIIGLLIGGTLLGRDLIKAAEFRSAIGDIEKYKTAINTFRLKYNELPGDMRDATGIWGTEPSCNWGKSTGTETCNGNGDGLIGSPTDDIFPVPNYAYEYYRFWQHLSNANLITGKFSGGASSNTGAYGSVEPGINVPKIFTKGCINVFRWNEIPALATYYPLVYKTLFFVGLPVANDVCYGALFTPSDAMSIDTKIDDGLPGYGNIVTLTPNYAPTANCTTSANQTVATYKTGYTSVACNLILPRIAQ